MRGRSKISARSPATDHDVPDELLELVFLRLPSSLHLVRAACTCKRWRRIIAHAAFLRRFRSRRASPVVAGHYRVNKLVHFSPPPGCNPVFFLSPSSDTVDLRPQHFSLDFLPSRNGGSWDIADSRGGLLLVNQCPGNNVAFFQDLVVCEPMTRRCRVIPPPGELRRKLTCGAFLLDGDADEAGEPISLSNFRIIVALVYEGVALACVFSSGNDNGNDSGWMVQIPMDSLVTPHNSLQFAGQAAGSIYWSNDVHEIIALDKDTEKFSCSLFPEEAMYCRHTFVGCDGGKVRLACLDRGHLKVFIQAEDTDEWVLEKDVELQQLASQVHGQDDGELQVNMLKKIISVEEGSVLLCTEKGVGQASVDLSTMEFTRVAPDDDRYFWPTYMYQLPWPPTIKACLD
ncbi:hypothetical protein QYE76_004587 [Lolium multiflorum]|uniref:F-box domain-containing protein n=1 Tax=Lolium multiflorum TaxID=4521 RepID=A0AAD8W0E0_LOLMU|nr:hypothetical protein QYE76_004587 [Lolium multiflorum]